jgi:hypothetical protein
MICPCDQVGEYITLILRELLAGFMHSLRARQPSLIVAVKWFDSQKPTYIKSIYI